MGKIWDFYEHLNEIVCAVDMEKYELVYLNHRAREVYGIKSMEEIKGRKCYEILGGGSAPCAICNNKELKQGYFLEWKHYNPHLGKMLAIKDTLIEEDGRSYRLEIAIDMGASGLHSGECAGNEAMINEGLRLSLSAPLPEKSIEILLEYLGQSLFCDRVYIFEETETGIFSNTYEWCAKNVRSQKENLQNLPFEVVKIWYGKFRKQENIMIKNLEITKEKDPAMYEVLKPQDIRTLVVSPLMSDNKIIGFYGVDNPPKEFMDHISTMFQIMGHFIVSLLKRRNLVRHLENLSFHDQLTELGNRRAMHAYMEAVDPEESIGILYCDVMGLKKANDSKGHKAGDDLLVRASGCLKKKFGDYKLFRVGGDEFLALCAGIEEKELLGRVNALREQMRKDKAFMALGCIWRADSRENMDKLLAKADERMYEEKRAYYQRINNFT